MRTVEGATDNVEMLEDLAPSSLLDEVPGD